MALFLIAFPNFLERQLPLVHCPLRWFAIGAIFVVTWLVLATAEFNQTPQVLHAKLFIVDEQVYVGSSNLDARSLNINYELLVRIGEQRVVDEAREIFGEALAHCRRVELRAWRRSRTLWTKLMETWAYFLLARVDPWWARGRARHLR